MSLQHLQPFQVDPNRVEQQEIAKLVATISSNSKISEIQSLLHRNISLCAYLFNAYIDYDEIYFLSNNIITNEDNRPDYICGCFNYRKGISWHVIICSGSLEQTWDDELQLTPVAKLAFDKLHYCTNNLAQILVENHLIDEVDPDTINGLLIIGQDREFFSNRKKQERKRDINQNSLVKLRTYGAFLRKFNKHNKQSWLNMPVTDLLAKLRK
ncbi:hypothetical protein [Chamaesiphon sp. VAR_48_metabat_403]|uniref:hypothetical protein n=1 Tax=Chamaesiphon sp. VAR_48_metabat_403 TaxID=2964700 RepID=UPI00286DBEA1|nr:hypothetical protein [Chamaesiphon sp. VAR_48_metabat_403]